MRDEAPALTDPERYSLLAQEIVAVIASLAPGEVVSYGDVAHDAGHPGAARAVGSLLSTTDVELPWWRVVRSDGRIVTADPDRQARRLRKEGVTVVDTPTGPKVKSSPSGRFRSRMKGDSPTEP
jgi:methylated-DNA-protein-cysteine methyltransferase-like protein